MPNKKKPPTVQDLGEPNITLSPLVRDFDIYNEVVRSAQEAKENPGLDWHSENASDDDETEDHSEYLAEEKTPANNTPEIEKSIAKDNAKVLQKLLTISNRFLHDIQQQMQQLQLDWQKAVAGPGKKSKNTKFAALVEAQEEITDLIDQCQRIAAHPDLGKKTLAAWIKNTGLGSELSRLRALHKSLTNSKQTPRVGWKGMLNVGQSKSAGLLDSYLNAMVNAAPDLKQFTHAGAAMPGQDDNLRLTLAATEPSQFYTALETKLAEFIEERQQQQRLTAKRTSKSPTDNATQKAHIIDKTIQEVAALQMEVATCFMPPSDYELANMALLLTSRMDQLLTSAKNIPHIGPGVKISAIFTPEVPLSKTAQKLATFINELSAMATAAKGYSNGPELI